VALRDHLVPGAGTLDFALLAALLPAGALATLEVDWYHDADEVEAGAARLRSALSAARGGPKDTWQGHTGVVY
jgi:hypothetical protein